MGSAVTPKHKGEPSVGGGELMVSLESANSVTMSILLSIKNT